MGKATREKAVSTKKLYDPSGDSQIKSSPYVLPTTSTEKEKAMRTVNSVPRCATGNIYMQSNV